MGELVANDGALVSLKCLRGALERQIVELVWLIVTLKGFLVPLGSLLLSLEAVLLLLGYHKVALVGLRVVLNPVLVILKLLQCSNGQTFSPFLE